MDTGKTIQLDLTGCKSLVELYRRIRIAFDFPDWCGRNWDAVWDLLWSDCDAELVQLLGVSTMPKELDQEIKRMYEVLQRNKEHREEYDGFFDFETIS